VLQECPYVNITAQHVLHEVLQTQQGPGVKVAAAGVIGLLEKHEYVCAANI
jgi:hypothetical protein